MLGKHIRATSRCVYGDIYNAGVMCEGIYVCTCTFTRTYFICTSPEKASYCFSRGTSNGSRLSTRIPLQDTPYYLVDYRGYTIYFEFLSFHMYAGADNSRSTFPMLTLISIAVATIVFLFLVMLTTIVVTICIRLKKKKFKNFKIEEDRQSVDHIYDTIDGFSNIQALHDPKYNLQTVKSNSQSLDVQMMNMQSNAAYDVVATELQSNVAYGIAVGYGT